MWKKAVTLAMVLGLSISSAAFAAEDQTADSALTARDEGLFQTAGSTISTRPGLSPRPQAATRRLANPARERMRELEELQTSDPEALKAKLLEEHAQMIARAQEIIDQRADLAQEIVDRALENQAKALKAATEAATKAADQELAQKRLELVKARQELMVTKVKKNAEQIADQMISRAEELLANSDSVKSRIENGEGLAVVKEWQQKWTRQAKHDRQQSMPNQAR